MTLASEAAYGGTRTPATPVIQSLVTGLRVLSVLTEMRGPQALTAVAKACDMTRTKAYKYLISLERSGFVQRTEDAGWYVLGPRAIRVGLTAIADLDVVRAAAAELPALAKHLGQSVFLSVWSETGASIVRWEDAGAAYGVNVRLGSRPPLLRSTPGYVFGAFLPEAVTRAAALRELKNPEHAYWGVRTYEDVRARFEAVRAKGFAHYPGRVFSGFDSVSAPVFGRSGEIAGVVTCIGPTSSMQQVGEDGVVAALRAASSAISAQLGLLK